MPEHPKQDLYDAIQQAAHTEGEEAVLTKYVVIAEFMMPDASKAVMRVSGDASHSSLKTWESAGLLTQTLAEVLGPPE